MLYSRFRFGQPLAFAACLGLLLSLVPSGLQAQSSIAPDVNGADAIANQQRTLADRYRQLEAKLYSLHQFEKDNNPTRSKLLREAFRQSQENTTVAQLDRLVGLLENEDYKTAETIQTETLNSLTEMLKLLQAEDRSLKIRDDIERYKAYAKEVDRILRIQRGIRGQAEGGIDAKRLADAQAKATERTKELADKVRDENESADGDLPAKSSEEDGTQDGPQRDDQNENRDQDTDDPGPDSSASDPQPKAGDQTPVEKSSDDASSESKQAGDSSSGKSQSGEPSAQPSEDGSSEDSQSQNDQSPDRAQDPIQRRIEAAQKRMEQAKQDLREAERNNAIDDMKAAEKELEAAKEELEDILRQLREEEVDSKLKLLKQRFREMLEQQVRVNEATDKLNQVPELARATEFEISSNRLSRDENQIAAAAGRALVLLKEDGSSIAFPVTVEELQQDMLTLAQRLADAKINEPTVSIEADIVETLNELIAALDKTIKNREEEKQKQAENPSSQPGAGTPGEESLVNQIAELKMLKSMQVRIHRRHQRYARMIDDPDDPVGVSEDPDIAAALRRLAQRQVQLTTITRQLINEENK